jgi:hypothetical protein
MVVCRYRQVVDDRLLTADQNKYKRYSDFGELWRAIFRLSYSIVRMNPCCVVSVQQRTDRRLHVLILATYQMAY